MPQPRAIVPDQGGVAAGLNSTGSPIAKYRLVKRGAAADTITPATDGSAPIEGVTMAAIPDGAAGDVQLARRTLVEAGGAIAIGANVTGGTGGKGAAGAAGDFVIGKANTEATTDGDIIEVDIEKMQLDSDT